MALNLWFESLRKLFNSVNIYVYMIQVQVRMPEKAVKEIDKWVEAGRFSSRSDAIKTIVSFYEDREKTRKFYKMLNKRSREAKNNPEELVPLSEL